MVALWRCPGRTVTVTVHALSCRRAVVLCCGVASFVASFVFATSVDRSQRLPPSRSIRSNSKLPLKVALLLFTQAAAAQDGAAEWAHVGRTSAGTKRS
jgi:hypothetical protein